MSIDDKLWDNENRKVEQQQEVYASDVYDTDLMLLKAFSTPNGRKALAYMKQVSHQFGADPNMGFDKGAAWGFFREGQAQMVWEIEQRMDRAKLGEPKGSEE